MMQMEAIGIQNESRHDKNERIIFRLSCQDEREGIFSAELMIDKENTERGKGKVAMIRGLGIASGLGGGVDAQIAAMESGSDIFRPLSELWGHDHAWSAFKGAWIPDRSLFKGRRQGPASSLALCLARQAVADAGWGTDELKDAAIVVGTSRGNAAGWLGDWSGRRRVKLLSVPQSLHSELASCVSIELGIHGPYHVVSSGCAAGLDAVGLAWMLLKCGAAKRALAIGLDLPLVPLLLDTYFDSRMLSESGANNPYHPAADGMVISEGGAAIAMELDGKDGRKGCPVLLDYRANSDAYGPLGMPPSGEYMAELMEKALDEIRLYGLELPLTVCPHASGTRGNAVSEQAALTRVFGDRDRDMPDFRLMKPWVGHAIGGSGILELALMTAFAREGKLPPNFKGLAAPVDGVCLSESVDLAGSRVIMKSASSMGGHNALVSIGVGDAFS